MTIDCDEIITISNGKKTAEIYSRAENPKVPSRFVHIEGSTVVWDHWKGEPKPCTTFVDVQASELAGLLADYDIVKSDEEYKLHFSEDGSYGVVGSAETRSTSIKTDFVATTKGSPIDIRLSSNFRHLLENVEGNLQLQLRQGYPFVANLTEVDGSNYMWLLNHRV